jgi:uncharacterized protein YjbJ (UPF0337 family)
MTSPRPAGRFRGPQAGKRPGDSYEGVRTMGDKTDRVSGTVKEAAGKVKNDPDLTAKGRREQMKGDVKKSGKKLKDAAEKL